MQTLSQKFITKHQWLVHSLYGQKYWDTPFFRRGKRRFQTVATKKCMYLKIVFPPLLQQFWSVWNDWTHMYKSLVFGDEFLAQGLHLKSHQRCSAAFCRPVKFFHTDWIIISLWSLPYGGHCITIKFWMHGEFCRIILYYYCNNTISVLQ